MDFRQIFRTSKKDERITELEAQVKTLEIDALNMEMTLASKDQRITDIVKLHEQDVARYIGINKKLSQESTERFETITELRKQLATSYEVETSQAEVIAQQKTVIQANAERIRELEANAAEHEVASQRYIKDIAELQGECLAIASENSDLIMFVRKCATGANIRADKPGGAKLVTDARALLKQYDSPVEVKEQ